MRYGFGSVARFLRVPEGVRLRRECFGGIAFDTRTGTTADLDREAFALLEHLRGGVPCREDRLPTRGAEQRRVIDRLLQAGLLATSAPAEDVVAATPARCTEAHEGKTEEWPAGPHLSAPHTVHWAITYACGLDCPDCYARRHRDRFPGEFPTADALRLVETLAAWGVFQLAIGGGEPLRRADLPAICRHARACGLVVHVTTGQTRVERGLLAALGAGVSVLQIGVRIDRILNDASGEAARLRCLAEQARDAGLLPGANVMLSRTGLAHFTRILGVLTEARLHRITLLRYKPPPTRARWRRECPTAGAMRQFERDLPDVLARYPEVVLRVDCALSFLQRHVGQADAQAAGVRGCVAGERILAVAPDGSLFPCSQLVYPHLRAGNLLTDDAPFVWANSPVLKRYRSFRAAAPFQQSACGACAAREHCGGCRVFAPDLLGADPGCPEPPLLPVTEGGPLP